MSRLLLHGFIMAMMAAATNAQDCPTPPVVLHSKLVAACSSEPARSAIGCSMYRLCNNATLTPAIFPYLCGTWNMEDREQLVQ